MDSLAKFLAPVLLVGAGAAVGALAAWRFTSPQSHVVLTERRGDRQREYLYYVSKADATLLASMPD